MKQPPKDSPVVLYPPRILVNGLSNKYKLIVDVKWGDFEQQISISREEGGFITKLITELNKALLEGSESSPFAK